MNILSILAWLGTLLPINRPVAAAADLICCPALFQRFLIDSNAGPNLLAKYLPSLLNAFKVGLLSPNPLRYFLSLAILPSFYPF